MTDAEEGNLYTVTEKNKDKPSTNPFRGSYLTWESVRYKTTDRTFRAGVRVRQKVLVVCVLDDYFLASAVLHEWF